MSDTSLNYIKVGNFWNIENTEIFLHVPFLKNSSDNYLKRIFKNDFQLSITDKDLEQLRNPRAESIRISNI